MINVNWECCFLSYSWCVFWLVKIVTHRNMIGWMIIVVGFWMTSQIFLSCYLLFTFSSEKWNVASCRREFFYFLTLKECYYLFLKVFFGRHLESDFKLSQNLYTDFEDDGNAMERARKWCDARTRTRSWRSRSSSFINLWEKQVKVSQFSLTITHFLRPISQWLQSHSRHNHTTTWIS